jgi:hypothetical protein
MRRPQAEMEVEFRSEPALRGPEKAIYRGGTEGYPKVNGNGLIALTSSRLLFRILVGTNVDIPLDEITGLREEVWFRRSMSGGRQHLIVQTTRGEVGFFVADNAAWIAAINAARQG